MGVVIDTGITVGPGITIRSDELELAWAEATFTTPGTYSWTCPEDVTSVCVVCVGGGGSGSAGYNSWYGNVGGGQYTGGGGGGLGWKNNIVVTPGQTYTVVVGSGGTTVTAQTTPPGLYYGYVKGISGGNSYFINESTVVGIGGDGGGRSASTFSSANGGGYVGTGGGYGGNGEFVQSGINRHASGGGAGGYSGNGGSLSVAATGGGGDSGGLAGSGPSGGGCGGSVGIYGEGSKGIDNRTSIGGFPGGGGGGSLQGTSAAGADGAVRIIWGNNRSFPTTNTDFLQGNRAVVSTDFLSKIDFGDARSYNYAYNLAFYDTRVGGAAATATGTGGTQYSNAYGGVLVFPAVDPLGSYYFLHTQRSYPFKLNSEVFGTDKNKKTIQLWIRFNTNITDNTVIFAYSDAQFGGNDYGYTLRAFANNSLAFMYKTPADGANAPYNRVYSTTDVIKPNNWYMITFTGILSANANTINVYLNDNSTPVISCATTSSSGFTGANNLFISDSYFSNAVPMSASVGLLYAYNKGLSNDEIVQNYDATKNRFLYSS